MKTWRFYGNNQNQFNSGQKMKDEMATGMRALFTNGTILGVVTMVEFELILKIVLLLLTIAFTGFQFYKSITKKEKNL